MLFEFQAMQDTHYFPNIIGTCGRLDFEEFVGPTLREIKNEPWIFRASIARQLIEMVQRFSTSKYRVYLTDVTADNFAIDENKRIKIVDAEDLVMVDSTNVKFSKLKKDLFYLIIH